MVSFRKGPAQWTALLVLPNARSLQTALSNTPSVPMLLEPTGITRILVSSLMLTQEKKSMSLKVTNTATDFEEL